MKRMIAVLLAAAMLCGVTAALALEPDGYVMSGGWITDQQVYSGSWQQAYQQILAAHSAAIHTYQDRTLYYNSKSVPCKPVSLMDITGDGTPELMFLETANSESRGDLYIYSASGVTTRCILYVPGITRLNYDDAGLGFDIYLSSADGGTLVLEYYEFERPWRLQLTRNAMNQYYLVSYLTVDADHSGVGDDTFYLNGTVVSGSDYDAALAKLRNGRYLAVSGYFADDDSYYGLLLDYETAVSVMSGFNQPTAVPPTSYPQPMPQPQPTPNYGGVYGLTIDKLATRTGPGTQYDGGGTYSVKNQYIKVLAKAWDKRNSIWWVKCEIPYHGEIRVLWTGWKRFDHSTISLDDLPEEFW